MYMGIHAIVREVKNSFNSIKSVNSVNYVNSVKSAMLVGWLVVVACGLYLARHLFTLFHMKASKLILDDVEDFGVGRFSKSTMSFYPLLEK